MSVVIDFPNPHAVKLSEDERQAARQAVRQQDAELQVLRDRTALLRRQLADLDRRADERVAEHGETTERVQSELADVEAELSRCIAERQPARPDLESKRIELLDALSRANELLEADVLPLSRTRENLEREIRDLQSQAAAGAPLLGKLASPPLANRDLWLRKFACGQHAVWADRRETAAKRQLGDAKAHLKQVGDERVARELAKVRVARWQAELEAAQQARSAAQAAADAAHQALIDE